MRITIVGSGKLAFQCAEISISRGFCTNVVEYKISGVSVLEKMCLAKNIDYKCLEKKALHDYLISISEETLVFSLMNTYLFPSDVIDNKALTIVNAHNSILPNHAGRNAEAWEIFDEDAEAGITWHVVTNKVDGGDILVQQKYEIGRDWNSIKLLGYQNKLEAEMFPIVLQKYLDNGLDNLIPMKKDGYQLHLSKDVPNNGELDTKWSASKIYAFLRALDYGPIKLLGTPYVVLDDSRYFWTKYSISDTEDDRECILMDSDIIKIIKDKKVITLLEVTKA